MCVGNSDCVQVAVYKCVTVRLKNVCSSSMLECRTSLDANGLKHNRTTRTLRSYTVHMRFGEVMKAAPRPFCSNPVFELRHTHNLLLALFSVLFCPCKTNSRHLRFGRQSGLVWELLTLGGGVSENLHFRLVWTSSSLVIVFHSSKRHSARQIMHREPPLSAAVT